MEFLAAVGPDITPIQDLINTWIHIGQVLVASVGACAFIFAFMCVRQTQQLGQPEHIYVRAATASKRKTSPR
jgi:hypothetical protein